MFNVKSETLANFYTPFTDHKSKLNRNSDEEEPRCENEAGEVVTYVEAQAC